MSTGKTRGFRRVITELLVVVGFLLSGVPDASIAALAHPSEHHDRLGVWTALATHPAKATPARSKHGRSCCIGCECVMHVAMLSTPTAALTDRSLLDTDYPVDPVANRSGIATIPARPPPRPVA